MLLDVDYRKVREECINGARLTTLHSDFSKMASGKSQVPNMSVIANKNFLAQDLELKRYHEIFQKNLGFMLHHYVASIPYMLEEFCRFGYALCKFQKKFHKKEGCSLYEVCSADGTNARTIGEYSLGKIRTLTDSPHIENKINFERSCRSKNSLFHLGPFFDITPEYIKSEERLSMFKDGFDFIQENTTFQFFGKNRKDYIAYVCRCLKEDGLFFATEKLSHENKIEYLKREEIKNNLFKSKYFSIEEIESKKASILSEMEKGQVCLDELVNATAILFKHIYLLWNSTNFYEIVASNNDEKIRAFLELLVEPYVPSPFCFETPMVRKLI